MLRQALELVHDFAIDEAEIARIERELHLTHAVHGAIKQACGEAFEERFLFARSADAVDAVCAFAFAEGQNVGDQLRRILQIGIHNHGPIGGALVNTGRYGGLMAKVAREVEHFHPWIFVG